MIVPMKKAAILFETRDAEITIKNLRKLGVLHVEHENLPESREISVLQEKVAHINSSLNTLNQRIAEGKIQQPQKTISGNWTAITGRINELSKLQDELDSSSRVIIGQINEWEPWGDIDLSQIQDLSQHGIFIQLYQIPVREISSFPDDVVIKTIFTIGDIAHSITISQRKFDCAFHEIAPPKQSVSSLKRRLIENNHQIETLEGEIIELTRFHDDLSGIKKKLEKEIEFHQVLSGMGRGGAINYVTGYIPYDIEDYLIAEGKNKQWGVVVTEPSVEDNVPTLIRNPAWVSIIKPVLGLLGLTPGYHELDVSTLFLIFFSIFFGILIGDAGYGLVYILITIVLQKTIMRDQAMKTTVSLFYLLGSSAIVWGILTGTFFGQGWLLQAGYKPLVPLLNDPQFMQTFCFFIGALHLSLAHSWRALLKLPSLSALADVGWICVLWTAFLLARTLILGESFPASGLWLIAAGVTLVILFTSPQKNFLRAIGEGLGTVALSLMNNFTDVISYVRLFAVGLASLAIAETTNTLATGFGDGAGALVAGVVIILIGHTLNIILGPMSVLVHGIRLNVLEFSGHANVTWSGIPFEPLKEEEG